ncbi:hypothetical protein NG895_06280 [Aeoliella sp. ICT_H6.2]|uniref:MucB/RseB N-terminal domain-containing protein n=1 Tax=Aeoliella straminimaris TaxID=2954799 RepID=A0A9X2F7X3_9BACT|nr:hypothetical protein [Aeoliella straminimaris]MCO6043509.1 hypothetical protein [Aeoliella straminimaris]
MRYLASLTLVTLLAACTSVRADDNQKITLTYKLKAGETLRYTIDHRASVRSTIEGTTQKAITRSESVKAWKVQDVMPDGEMEFTHIVEQVRMVNRLPDRAEMVYDSEEDKTPPPGFEDAAAAVGTVLSVIRMSPRGEVIERDVKHHQPAADTEAPVTLLLPEKPVAVGDTWNEPRSVPVQTADGAKREIQTRRHYELIKVSAGVATIEVSYQVLSPIDPAIEAQLVQRLMKGTVKFDIAAGRVLSQEMEVDQRVLGFAGPTSSMHYLMQMDERLLDGEKKEIASKP